MNRSYMGYVGEACKKGMSPEEVQYLFNDIYSKANTKFGKRVLKLFSKGIGKAKKKVLEQQMAKQVEQQQITQAMPQMDIPQMQKTLGTYKQ